MAVPALARLSRYGSVRQTDAAAVVQILDGFSARIHVGLIGAVSGIDEDAAAQWRTAILDYHGALMLIESERLKECRDVLRRLLNNSGTNPLLSGTAARVLLDCGDLTAAGTAQNLGLALSRGQDPANAAAWLEGFLSGQGAVLVHDPNLLPLLEDWVAGLSDETFLAVLPLVRRTFATFEGPERSRIAQRLGRPRTSANASSNTHAEWDIDAGRAKLVLPVVGELLGITTAPSSSP